MTGPTNDFIRGTLEMLVLKVVRLEPMHGWGISERVQMLSKDSLSFSPGSLYPVLAKLQRTGMLESEWGRTENNRRARFYRLTPEGERRLDAEHANWRRLSAAVNWIMETAN